MKRRDVLRFGGLSAGLVSGCLSPSTHSIPGDTDTPTKTPSSVDDRPTTASSSVTTIEKGIPRTVTLKPRTTTKLRDTFGIEAHVAVLASSVTRKHTARIQVTLENTTTHTQTLTYTRETCDLNLISGHYQREKNIRLLLISTEQLEKRTEDECWVPDVRNLNCGIPTMEYEITVAPDESLRWTFCLWDSPENHDNRVCMPLGVYQFIRTFSQENTEAPLTFTLSVNSG